MDLIREQSPILIQLSTGVGLETPYEEREQLVELRPRMATLNPCSMSFGMGEFRNPPLGVRRLAARMRELGVKPELEIYDFGHIPVCLALYEEDLLAAPLQFSIVMGVKGGMAATAANLLYAVRMLPRDAIWQIIAVGRSNLELSAVGVAIGGNARTGMEDTLHMRKGELAPSNEALVARLANVCGVLERSIATVEDVEKAFGLGPDPSLSSRDHAIGGIGASTPCFRPLASRSAHDKSSEPSGERNSAIPIDGLSSKRDLPSVYLSTIRCPSS
jgi:uncharacterized protein (DUF849 family)